MNFKACAVTATSSSSTAVVVTPPAVVKGSFIRRERNNKNRRVIRADANGHTPIFFADVQKSIQSVDVGLLQCENKDRVRPGRKHRCVDMHTCVHVSSSLLSLSLSVLSVCLCLSPHTRTLHTRYKPRWPARACKGDRARLRHIHVCIHACLQW